MGVLRANVEQLAIAGNQVVGHGEDLAAGHLAADNRIEAANAAWIGSSAAALSARTTRWRQTTTTLLARVSDHAQGLHAAAYAYGENEDARATDFTALSRAAGTAQTGRA